MQFVKLLFQALALLPSLVQGIEMLYGARTGVAKREAAVAIVGSAIHVVDATTQKTIVDADKFTAALGLIVDGVVACLNASIWSKA